MFLNKTIIITGAANGIGYATAQAFLENGGNVVIADVSEIDGKKAEETLLKNFEGKCLFIQTDTSNEEDVKNMVTKTIERFGEISILVNGAAAFIMKGIDATAEDWANICKVNIGGYALCAKYCVPSMIKAGNGAIINICSISAFIAQPNFVTYAATKGAVASMTRCMALDLAKYNIRVNAINPGTVWTESNEKFHREVLNMSRADADNHPEIGGMHILKRTADPREIAETILFLASEKASYITAANMMIDGGYTAL
jgi:dihydroanticapsin dehydrogenase